MGRFLLVSVALALLVAGCATPTPYQPARDGYGYYDQRIENDRYRITVSANTLTSRDTVENYLLYRAAQVTIQTGNNYFTIVHESVVPRTTYSGSTTFGDGFAPYYGYPYNMGFGVGTSTLTPQTSYQASAIIVVSKGKKRSDKALQTYNAQQVIQRLTPAIQYPNQMGQ